MRLDLMTWPQVDERLKSDRAIVLPIGSVEQHGPTGLMGTDALVAEAVARRAGDLDDLLIGPTFSIGVAAHHMAFAGTISLSAGTFMAALCEWITSLVTHGFDHIYVLNGHGGNIQAIRRSFQTLEGELGSRAPKMVLRNWWEFEPVTQMREALYTKAEGHHATPSEIAITQYLYAEARLAARPLEPLVAPNGPIRNAQDYRARFPDGRIGSNPALANAADGEKLLQSASLALIDDFRQFTVAGRALSD